MCAQPLMGTFCLLLIFSWQTMPGKYFHDYPFAPQYTAIIT